MKTAFLYGSRDLRLEEIPAPSPGPGEVLVRIGAAGICGSDLHRYRGDDPWSPTQVCQPQLGKPRRLGHELAGVVVELGRGVHGLEAGQRVGVEPMQLAGCGACPPCRRGDYHLCGGRDHDPQRRRSAGFSELDVAGVGNVFPLPEQVSLAAASLADVYACAVHAIHRVPIEMSSTVAILGTGPIGMALGQIARAVGARRTILIGRRPEPLDQALAAGAANHTVDASREESLAAAVRALTDGEGAAVVFEAVGGSGDTLRQAVAMARPGAVVGILGAFVGDVAVAYREANAKELDLRWSNGYSTWRGAREFQIALGLIAEGRVEAAPLITHRYPLERIAEAFAAADDKRSSGAIKVVVEPS